MLISFFVIICLYIGGSLSIFDIYVYKEDVNDRYNETRHEDFVEQIQASKDDNDSYSNIEKPDDNLQCSTVPISNRFDCYPGTFPNEEKCLQRGCCWMAPGDRVSFQNQSSAEKKINIPYCFYPNGYQSHLLTDIKYSQKGVSAWYDRIRDSGYPKDSPKIRLDVGCYKNTGLRIKIWDESKQSQKQAIKDTIELLPLEACNVFLRVSENVFGFQLLRKDSHGTVLFDCLDVGGFVFSDQLLQISSLLPSNYIYGLGEHTGRLLRKTNWNQYTFWNRDYIPYEEKNIYGTHPFYMALEDTGTAHGVYFRNTHAMEVILQPTPAMTFRALGGFMEIYILLGETPIAVVEQYTDLIGKPFLPPYWSLGYHQCKFAYNSLSRTKKILNQTREAKIPIDVQWNDIDYMDQNKDFTYDAEKYQGLPEFVQELHAQGLKYIQIIDPGISGSEIPGTYPPYDKGLAMDIFVKNSSNMPFVGKVWNTQSTVWPDFTNPHILEYWQTLLNDYHKVIEIDGVWIDMNEPSNFFDGQKDGCSKDGDDFDLDEPFYIPKGVTGNKLYAKTICPSARQYKGFHYEFHNTYGLDETIATAKAMKNVRKKRPFVVSRSTFPGQGNHGAHWTGDVVSSWDHLRASIASVINFNMFGIPMVGADICGFNGNTTVELCNRWVQLGAFYPFSRNHNTDNGIDQDPVSLGEPVITSARNALNIRYRLLPYLYTLMVKAHRDGSPAVRSMLMNYPTDRKTFALDNQFMWGTDLLVLPVLAEKTYKVTGYFPRNTWYNLHDKTHLVSGVGHFESVHAAETIIPLFIRGGSILPLQMNGLTTVESRNNPFHLEIYFPLDPKCSTCNLEAVGDLYLDDGDDVESYTKNHFIYIKFSSVVSEAMKGGRLVSKVQKGSDINLNQNTFLQEIIIYGIRNVGSITSVKINGSPIEFTKEHSCLSINNISHDLKHEFELTWNKKLL